MRGFPIPMLIRRAEPCDTQRSRITERAAEVSEIGSIRDRSLERDDNCARIVAQEMMGQLGVFQPRTSIATCCEQSWEFIGGSFAQRYKVHRLTPFRRLFCTPSRRHLADNEGQHLGRMSPAKEIEALEGFVGEVERMSAIGKGAVGLGG